MTKQTRCMFQSYQAKKRGKSISPSVNQFGKRHSDDSGRFQLNQFIKERRLEGSLFTV